MMMTTMMVMIYNGNGHDINKSYDCNGDSKKMVQIILVVISISTDVNGA